ncbi:MAG: hypothetical protein HY681_13200 [Chloroflexi bacterium]|nr:hypothetical protein [Chloroflexota bacterium]
MATPPRRRGFPVFGLLLIAVGGLLLLQTLGIVPWSVWADLWRLWPAALIASGIGIIFGKRAPWLAGALIALLLAGAVAFAAFGNNGLKQDAVERTTLSEPLGGAKSLNVTLDFGAGNIALGSLATGSSNIIEGVFDGNPQGVGETVARRGDMVEVTLQRKSPRFFFGGVSEEWDVRLSRNVAIELTLNAGASEINADLADLNVTDLAVKAGASDVSVTLPGKAERTFARLEVGAAELDVRVPAGVAARIRADAGVASVDVDQARFPKRGDVYESPDFDTADRRVEVEIRGGVADITVQ